MTKIIRVKEEIPNPEYPKALIEQMKKESRWTRFWKFFSFGWIEDVGVPYYMNNPRIAEIFLNPAEIRNWHIERGYFYIEVIDDFEEKEFELFE